MKISSLRILAYALICCGLINLDYQRHKPHIVAFSSVAVGLGVLLVLASFNKIFKGKIASKILASVVLIISLTTLILQFINF